MGDVRMAANPNSGSDGDPGSGAVGAGAAGGIFLVYDRQCPVCDAYCRLVRVRPSSGTLHLIDARAPSAIMDEITAAGLDIDEGMVVRMDGRLHYGSAAISALARHGARSGIFNRLNSVVFGSQRAARAIYPLLRACRNLLLKCLGRTRINNLRIPGNERF